MANSNLRVSLKFSEHDPDQEEVVKLLKQMGRRKSAFITKAIKYYLDENPNADIPGVTSTTISKSSVKALLKELLSEMDININENKNNSNKKIEKVNNKDNISENSQKEEPKIEEIPKQSEIDEIPEEIVDEFLDSLDLFEI